MSKVIRVRYENGLLKPLEPLELREGVEPGVQLLPEEFPELVEKVSVEAKEGVGRVLRGPHALGRVVLDSSVLVESVLRPGSWPPAASTALETRRKAGMVVRLLGGREYGVLHRTLL